MKWDVLVPGFEVDGEDEVEVACFEGAKRIQVIIGEARVQRTGYYVFLCL